MTIMPLLGAFFIDEVIIKGIQPMPFQLMQIQDSLTSGSFVSHV